MKRLAIFLTSALLIGCSSVELSSDPARASSLPTSAVIKPFVLNPNVLNLSQQLRDEYQGDPDVKVLRVGNEIKITYSSDALFGVSGVVLSPNAPSTLDPLIHVINLFPETVARVDCFTDTSGSAEKNLSYSSQRAENVMRYLNSYGVAVDRVSSKGYGGSSLIANNDTPEGRALNRRVVVTLSKIPELPAKSKA